MSASTGEDDAIGTEAAHWLAAMRGPDAEARRGAFETWRASDPRHARAYAHVETLFALSGFAERTPRGREAVLVEPGSPPRPRASRPPAWLPIGIAASLVALIALGTVAYTNFSHAPAPQVAQQTDTGAPQLRRLGDGSLVLLAAATLVTANLSDAIRQIRIGTGRARFIVAPDPARPFVIAARGHSIRSSAGIFDVALVGTGVEVTAYRGNVTVGASAGGPPRTVDPGSTIRFDAEGTLTVVAPADVGDWPPARLDFDGTTLADIIALANSFGNTPIVAATPEIARLRVSGTFDIRDKVALARKIAAALDLQIAQSAGHIVLARNR